MSSITYTVRPGLAKVDHSTLTANHILLELTGFRGKTFEKRPHLDMIAVVDTSTSMGANKKMENVKRTLELLVKNMSQDDHLSIVEYNSASRAALPRTRISQEFQPRITQAIASLFPQEWTNFGAALSAAYAVAARDEEKGSSIKRIIFFTDGCPTSGVTDSDRIVELCRQKPKEWRISTMGYGIDSPTGNDVDLDLLAKMASAGQGNFYYMKDAESTAKAFATELGGLISVVAEGIRVSITPSGDRIKIKKLLEDMENEMTHESMEVSIPDLLADETKRLTFAVDCLPQAKPDRFLNHRVADITLEYLDLSQTKFVRDRVQADIEFVAGGKESETVLQEVAEQIAFTAATRAQKKALARAERGDFQAAKNIMKMAIKALKDVGTQRAIKLSQGFDATAQTLEDEEAFDRGKTDYTVSMYESSSGRSAGGLFSEEFYTPTLRESVTVFIEDLPDTIDFDPDEVTHTIEASDYDDDETQEVGGADVQGDESEITEDLDDSFQKPKISAKHVIADLISQKDNKAIMIKYGLSVKGLRSLFKKLVNAGLMSQEDFRRRMGPQNTD